ncbi:MAG: hypothetical protein AB8B63_12380 [Granulosicoccus sp.]
MSERLKPLDLYSEPYASTGNLGDSGMRKLLGAPTLDLLQTVIRESVQNSCDAAKLGVGPRLQFRLRTLTDGQMRFLTDTVLVNIPPLPVDDPSLGEPLLPQPGDPAIRVLEIIDYNTTGLAGPVRADRLPAGVRYTDFIDFFRNVGTARNTNSGGGTYGFGKSSLYLTSRCSTILVDSQTEVVGQPVRRLMGCHIGGSYQLPSEDGHVRPFTGRHWWGQSEGTDSVVDPLENDLAQTAATNLGMPARGLSERGTTVMILAPELGNESPEMVGQRIVTELLWHFWPRMTRDTPAEKHLDASVIVEDRELEFPSPEDWPPLNLYCDALAQIRRRDKPHHRDQVQTISSQRPKRLLGYCSTVKGFVAPRTGASPERAHSIALMRPVGFIVKYLEGPQLPNENLEWAGVFVVDDDAQTESAFANAEPPAHDDWQSALLSKDEGQTFVRVALRNLKKIADAMADVTPTNSSTAHAAAGTAVKVANCLGSLLGGAERDSKQRHVRTQRGRRRKPDRVGHVSVPRFYRIGVERETAFAEFGIAVINGLSPCQLELEARPVVDGVLVKTPKLNDRDDTFLTLPEILSVIGPDGQSLTVQGEGRFTVPDQFKGEVLVRTTLPAAMLIGLRATLNEMVEVKV